MQKVGRIFSYLFNVQKVQVRFEDFQPLQKVGILFIDYPQSLGPYFLFLILYFSIPVSGSIIFSFPKLLFMKQNLTTLCL
jgi:hypothetical protein